MAQVYMPQMQRRKSELEQLLPIGGAIVGGIAGGPAGAMTGASIASQAPSLLGQQQQQPMQPQQVETSISRRKMQLDQTPLREIAQSIDSLKYIKDDQTRAQLAKPLLQAQYMAKGEV